MNCSDGHSWFFISNWALSKEDRSEKIDCAFPVKMACRYCSENYLKFCGATKDSKCVPCALRAKRDKKLALSSGLNKSPMGWLEISLTAPGANELPWNTVVCNHNSSMSCSGKIGCKVDEIDGAEFNTRMPKNWNRYMQAVRRLFKADIQYGKVFEAQTRDVLHIHALLVGAPNWPIKRINKELRRLAKVHGMGSQISVKRVSGDGPMDKAKAVGYVAKYLTKGSKTLKTISLVTGEIKSGGYRDFTQSRAFGDSLKDIRRKRFLHFQLAQTVEGAGTSKISEHGEETCDDQRGDVVALDNYKKSYTLQT